MIGNIVRAPILSLCSLFTITFTRALYYCGVDSVEMIGSYDKLLKNDVLMIFTALYVITIEQEPMNWF